MFKQFKSHINYIGATHKQHNLTNKLSKKYPDINFTAYKHDIHYTLMLAERNHLVRFFMKLMYDLIFLVLGIIRVLKNWRVDGITIVIILYLLLLISSFNYLWKHRKTEINLD